MERYSHGSVFPTSGTRPLTNHAADVDFPGINDATWASTNHYADPTFGGAHSSFLTKNAPSSATPPQGLSSAVAGSSYLDAIKYAQSTNTLADPGLGTWSELIAGGVVDKDYIEQEAERRKQEIDRAMDAQIARLEDQCQEHRSSIVQQAEYHTQMAEKQIEGHKRQHIANVTRQAELQAYSILQRVEIEKGRLGQEAARALTRRSEHEKATLLHESVRRTEEVWRQSQRALLEQAQKSKAEIDLQTQRRTADVEREVREAVSRLYLSPHSPMAPVGTPHAAK